MKYNYTRGIKKLTNKTTLTREYTQKKIFTDKSHQYLRFPPFRSNRTIFNRHIFPNSVQNIILQKEKKNEIKIEKEKMNHKKNLHITLPFSSKYSPFSLLIRSIVE